MAALLTEIASIIREVAQDTALDLQETTRFEDLANWDSMDLISVAVEIECRFDIQFELMEIDRFVTVGHLLRTIELKQALTAA